MGNSGAKMERQPALYVFRAEEKQFDRRCQFVGAKRKGRVRGSLGVTFRRRFDARLSGALLGSWGTMTHCTVEMCDVISVLGVFRPACLPSFPSFHFFFPLKTATENQS